MSEAWQMEPATADDDAALSALSQRALTDPWSASGFAAERANAHARIRVVRADGGVVGYLVVHLVTDELEVLSIAVEPGWRRRGIARALLGAALDDARASGTRVAHLEVRAASAPARALYASFGFADSGRRFRYYADGEDAIRMRREFEESRSPQRDDSHVQAGDRSGRIL